MKKYWTGCLDDLAKFIIILMRFLENFPQHKMQWRKFKNIIAERKDKSVTGQDFNAQYMDTTAACTNRDCERKNE